MPPQTFLYREFQKYSLQRFVMDEAYDVALEPLYMALFRAGRYQPSPLDTYAVIPRTSRCGRATKLLNVRCCDRDLYVDPCRIVLPHACHIGGFFLFLQVPRKLLVSCSTVGFPVYSKNITLTFPEGGMVINTSHVYDDALCIRELLREGKIFA
jgi:hypothetical protein